LFSIDETEGITRADERPTNAKNPRVPGIAFAGDLGAAGYSGPHRGERVAARYRVRFHRGIVAETHIAIFRAEAEREGISTRLMGETRGLLLTHRLFLVVLSIPRKRRVLKASPTSSTRHSCGYEHNNGLGRYGIRRKT